MMFWPSLCLLLLAIPSHVLVQSVSDDIAVVEVSDGRIFLPSAASVCSTITTTINDIVDYIPVPCTDISHPAIWSEEVIVDGTTAELIIAPSGHVRFISETWINANPPASIPTRSQSTFSTNVTANSTASASRRNGFSTYVSPNSTSGVVMSSVEARSSSPTSAATMSVYFPNATSGSGTSSMSLSTRLNFLNKSSGLVTSSISIRPGLISYESAATSSSPNLTWSSSTRAGVSSVTQSNLFSPISGALSGYTSSSNITFGYTTSSATRLVNTNRESSSSQLKLNSSSSAFLPSSPSSIPSSQSSHEPGNNTSNTSSTNGGSSATTSRNSVSAAAFATTSSSPSIPTITPPPKSSVFTSGNFTPPISSDLAAFATSGPSLITLSISGQSIVLMRQTMSGFENFTGTTTVTTSEATTNSAGAIAWATGSVIIGTEGVFWGLTLGAISTGKFCIWPFCSGGGKSASLICIWPFCGGTGGGVTGGGGGGGGGEGDGDNNNSGNNDEQTQPDQTTQEQKTAQSSDPKSTPTPTSTLPKSTSVSTTSSAPACPLFSIPSDSLTNDGSPTWNPNAPEYVGDIVAAAYAIWLVDSGSGSEILPPLPASTVSGDAVLIGYIPNAGSGGGNSTNGTLFSTNNSSSSTTMMTTPMPGAVNSAAAAASAASVTSASSASLASIQSVESEQRVASASSASLASVQSVESAQGAASASSVLSAARVISSLSAASAISAASALSVASSLSAASALSVASQPTPTPNLAIIIIRNDNCEDVSCGSIGYIYDVTPLSPNVSDICTNPSPTSTASFQYTEDVSNEPDDYPINSGKFTSHGVYTNCQYLQNSLATFGVFWCDQVEPVWCSVPTMPAYSCTDSNSLDEDDEVPIAYCEWVGTTTATRTTSAAPPATSSPRTCQVETTLFAGRIVTGHWCKCSDGTKPVPYVSGKEWTCPDEIAS